MVEWFPWLKWYRNAVVVCINGGRRGGAEMNSQCLRGGVALPLLLLQNCHGAGVTAVAVLPWLVLALMVVVA